MADNSYTGISIEKFSFNEYQFEDKALSAASSEEGSQAHRHDSHSFFLLESGTVNIELDFQHYTINSPSVIYVHPDQVHNTILSENVIVSSWAITDENLNPDYLKLLEDLAPAKPLVLTNEIFLLISEAISLCMKFSERKNCKLYHTILKDGCNALVALVLAQYLDSAKSTQKVSRFDIVTKTFKEILESNYIIAKSPAYYAAKLNISAPYLNECVKNATGYTVSYHIQQRVILEAKRLLYYSKQSVKEIAAALGYDDYPYFSRLFTRATGMSALAFRNKNHD